MLEPGNNVSLSKYCKISSYRSGKQSNKPNNRLNAVNFGLIDKF